MLLLVHNTITEICSEKSPSPPILVECPDETPVRPSQSFLWPRHHQIQLHRIFNKSGVASSGHFSTARVQSRRFDVHQKKGQHLSARARVKSFSVERAVSKVRVSALPGFNPRIFFQRWWGIIIGEYVSAREEVHIRLFHSHSTSSSRIKTPTMRPPIVCNSFSIHWNPSLVFTLPPRLVYFSRKRSANLMIL